MISVDLVKRTLFGRLHGTLDKYAVCVERVDRITAFDNQVIVDVKSRLFFNAKYDNSWGTVYCPGPNGYAAFVSKTEVIDIIRDELGYATPETLAIGTHMTRRNAGIFGRLRNMITEIHFNVQSVGPSPLMHSPNKQIPAVQMFDHRDQMLAYCFYENGIMHRNWGPSEMWAVYRGRDMSLVAFHTHVHGSHVGSSRHNLRDTRKIGTGLLTVNKTIPRDAYRNVKRYEFPQNQ